MKRYLYNKPLVIALTVIVLVLGGLFIAWRSAVYTLDHLSFRQVSTSQMATAMRKDEFWSSYRYNTLVFEGKVQKISVDNGKTTLGFYTSDAYGASCELTTNGSEFKIGHTYKFAAETYQAERQPHGVLLHNCLSL